MKKQSVGCIASLFSCLFIFLLLFIGIGVSQCSYEAKEELPFSNTLESNYPAYIDIVSIEPVYSLSTNHGSYVSDVVCKCETSSHQIVWLCIKTYDYEKYFDKDAEFGGMFNNSFKKVYVSTRIHGSTATAEDIATGLGAKTSQLVLRFKSVEKG